MAKLISANELRELAGDCKQVAIPQGCILTPSAYDLARELKLTLLPSDHKAEQKDDREKMQANAMESMPVQSHDTISLIVKRVIERLHQPACPQPRLTHIAGNDVKLDPFDKAPPGQCVKLKDVLTSREANLGAGFMEFDHSEFNWHLTYDEVDYVVSGTFTLKSGGKTYTCQAGDVLYIPKDSPVVFGSPSQARVFYVTYPVNWADLQA